MVLWKKYKLEELVDKARGISYGIVQPGTFVNDGIPIIKVNNITDRTFALKQIQKVKPEVESKYQRTRLRGNELLISLVGSLGFVAKVTDEMIGWNVARAVGVLPIAASFDREWIYWHLKSPVVQNAIINSASTSVQATLNLKELQEIEIAYPDAIYRSRAVEILSALEDKIELNRRTNGTLEQMAQTLFRHYFVDGIDKDNLPEGWRIGKVGDYISSVSVTHKFPKSEVIFLNTSDILDGKVLHNNYSDVETLPGQAKKSIKKDDFLFSEIRPANRRFAYINFEADNYVVSTKLMVLRAKAELNSLFFFFLLTRDEMLLELQNIAESRSGTFPQITFDQLRSLTFYYPDDDSLSKFIETTLKPVYQKIFKNNQEIRTLTTLRDTLLPKLMSGEIDVHQLQNVAEYEPVLG